MWSRTGKLERSNESIASVEWSVSRGTKDRVLDSVQTRSEMQNLHLYLEQKAESVVRGESAAQKRLSEAEVDMEIRSWNRPIENSNLKDGK